METHDASTSKRYLAAAQEAQATIAKQEQTLESLGAALNELRAITKAGDCHMSFETLIRAGCTAIAARDARIAALEAHIREAASLDIAKRVDKNHRGCRISVAEWHLAALNHTEDEKKIDYAVDKAWGRFCAAMPHDQSPYPGMAKAFEVHYGVSWTDRDWRNEQSTWAAAWRMAWDRRATVLDAEQDAARLDFLDSIGAAYGFEDTHEGNRWMIDGPFNSLRAAIDAAIDAAIEKGGA